MSRLVHGKQLPVLVSPLFLREREMGQVDLVGLVKNNDGLCLNVYEVKSSSYIALWQKRRLLHSSHFLGLLFKASVNLKVLSEESCII